MLDKSSLLWFPQHLTSPIFVLKGKNSMIFFLLWRKRVIKTISIFCETIFGIMSWVCLLHNGLYFTVSVEWNIVEDWRCNSDDRICLACVKPWTSPMPCNLDVVACVCDLSTRELEAGGNLASFSNAQYSASLGSTDNASKQNDRQKNSLKWKLSLENFSNRVIKNIMHEAGSGGVCP